MRVLVLYESHRGFTLTVARGLRDELRALGADASTAPLRNVDAGTVAASESLVVGTWVKGLLIAGVGPATGTYQGIQRLPHLDGRPTVMFCTCAFSARHTLDTLGDWLEDRGADVRGRVVFRRKKSLRNAPGVAASILDVLQRPA